MGAKSKVYNCAIELFMLKGFNDVSLRDIADAVGIRQSSIYNHFKSKQELLGTIYDYYCYYYLNDRPSLNDMDVVLQNESLTEIIHYIRYDYPSPDSMIKFKEDEQALCKYAAGLITDLKSFK